jgi:hypothetical protein
VRIVIITSNRHSTEERRLHHRIDSGSQLRPGDAWTCDHIQAVINGGANRETTLHPLCEWCEPPKTEADVHEKSRTHGRRLHHAGIKLASKWRPLPDTIASGWKHRMDGGRERRRPSGCALNAQGLGASEIAKALKIGRASVYRALEAGSAASGSRIALDLSSGVRRP